MKKIIILISFILFGITSKDSYAAVITTPCPDDQGGGKYNHCTPESRGCDDFEFNRDGDGNTNQDCTDRVFPSGTRKAICCQLKPMASYPPGDIVDPNCPTIRSDGHMNYCVPGNSCGSYAPVTAPGADNACSVYYYDGASPAKCCKSPFTIAVGSASGSSKVTGKFYLDANSDNTYNTGDSVLDGQLVSLGTGQTDTTDASGDYELNDVPLGGNTITFKFDKNGNIAELKSSISVAGSSMVYDFPLTLDKVGGGSGGGGTPATPSSGLDIKAIIDSVSEAKIKDYLNNLVGKTAPGDNLQARYSCATGNAEEREYIKSHFTSLGLVVEEQSVSAGGCTTKNIIGRYEGANKNSVFMVTAHMDSVADRSGTNDPSPGADDNGSGTSTVMEIARVIATAKPALDHSVEFVLFSGEEQGLLGSKYYANNLSRDLKGLMNLDMVGISDSGSACIDFAYGSGGLGSAFASKAVDINTTYSIGLSARSVEAVIPYSDHWPFQAKGKQAAFAYECVIDSTISSPVYHSLNDKVENIDFSQLTKTAKVVSGALVDLADD